MERLSPRCLKIVIFFVFGTPERMRSFSNAYGGEVRNLSGVRLVGVHPYSTFYIAIRPLLSLSQ
jgi:hypothetical protein